MIHLLVHLVLLALRSSESNARRLPPARESFGPRILSAATVKQFALGYGQCYLLTNILVEGTKCFRFILAVHDFAGAPSMLIAAESDLGDENNVLTLGVYKPGGYENLGPSESLSDINLFHDVAVEVARSRLGIE